MSINIGSECTAAVAQLRGNPHWDTIRIALLEVVRKYANDALDNYGRDDMVGYARALRDLHVAFEAATNGHPYNRVEKPAPVKGSRNYAA